MQFQPGFSQFLFTKFTLWEINRQAVTIEMFFSKIIYESILAPGFNHRRVKLTFAHLRRAPLLGC
jgi:hypothetical protein